MEQSDGRTEMLIAYQAQIFRSTGQRISLMTAQVQLARLTGTAETASDRIESEANYLADTGQHWGDRFAQLESKKQRY